MPRGGARTGQAGVAYENRTDLNGDTGSGTMSGQVRPYGGAGRTAPSSVRGTGPQGREGGPSGGAPMRQDPRLGDPTNRPGEPITAGLGSAGGESILPDDPRAFLKMLSQRYPNNDDIRRLLARWGS